MKKLFKNIVLLLFGLILISCQYSSQQDKNNKIEKYKSENYEPESLDDVLDYMSYYWSEKEKNDFKNKEEQKATIDLHFGYGMFIRNQWIRHGNPKLNAFFNENKVYHPDDISDIILISFHRKLNNKDIELKEQIEFYKSYWSEIEKVERKEKMQDFEKYDIGDTLTFKYLRTFVNSKQEELYKSKRCVSKGILLEKRESDFHTKNIMF